MELTFVAMAMAECEEEFEDLPCLLCGCGKVASVGGRRYMDENYEVVDGGWLVPWCDCVQSGL
jgi:hypothetical protein